MPSIAQTPPKKPAQKKPLPRTEYEECKDFASYLRVMGLQFSHIPNETRTPSFGQRAKNKYMGVVAGVPDYIVIVPREIVVNRPNMVGKDNDLLVFIEMKRTVGGKISESQQLWLASLTRCGAYCKVCNGFVEAKEYIELIMSGRL